MDNISNIDRANRAGKALETFAYLSRAPIDEETFTNFLASLRHLATRLDLDFANLVSNSANIHRGELAQERYNSSIVLKFNQDEALSDGWGVFQKENGTHAIKFWGDDPNDRFYSDQDAVNHVRKRARDGSHLHMAALLITGTSLWEK